MAKSLYVSAAEPYSGKIIVSFGIMEMLARTINRLGFFRPIARPYRPIGTEKDVPDRDIYLIHEYFKLECPMSEMYGATAQEAEKMISDGKQNQLMEKILDAYKRLEEKVDFVLCEGTDYLSAVTSSVETDFNSQVARDLNTPVLLVVEGSSNDPETIYSQGKVGLETFHEKGCKVIAAIINKVDRELIDKVKDDVSSKLNEAGLKTLGIIPKDPFLAMPRMDEVAAHLNGRVLFGKDFLSNKIGKIIVASGSVQTMIPLLDNNLLLVTHIDRHDAIFMALIALQSHNAPNIGGMVLSGEYEMAEPVMHLLQGLPGPRFPIVRSPNKNTYETIIALTKLKATLEPRNTREIATALQYFETNVDTNVLADAIRLSASNLMTPKLFKYELVKKARSNKKHIVLPEGKDERILKAADALLRLKAVDLTILGNPNEIRTKAGQLNLELDEAQIIDPQNSEWLDEFVNIIYKERSHKGVTKELATELVQDIATFGTLMVHTGRADGMVSGATMSTASTIRPAFQFIKTKSNCKLVSSVFFMCLEDRVLVYGDCAVNPDPTATELADIALISAETARSFGIKPIVAMLSYSTGESGQGADVDKVKEAVRIAKKSNPDFPLEGPIQYDAAVDASVAKSKLPGSKVGGKATVFIFPDLNTGNNTYKAVQRSAHAVAIGPVLQGLNKPVNDLSRGCLVEDIINTVAITAIQAQTKK